MKKHDTIPDKPNSAYYVNYRPTSQSSVINYMPESSADPKSLPSRLAQKISVRMPRPVSEKQD
jgi:hypothetical protein